MVCALREQVEVVFGEQNQVGSSVSSDVPGSQGIGRELSILNRPPFGRTPAIGALVILHHQFLGLPIIRNIRPSILV